MAHGAMLWGAALYNNGGFHIKDTRFGESYNEDGNPQTLLANPTADARRSKHLKVFCRFSNRFRVGKSHSPEIFCAFLNAAGEGVWKSVCLTKKKKTASPIKV